MQIAQLFVICLLFSGALILFYVTQFHANYVHLYIRTDMNNADVDAVPTYNMDTMESTRDALKQRTLTAYGDINKNAQEDANVDGKLSGEEEEIIKDFTNQTEKTDGTTVGHINKPTINNNTVRNNSQRYRLKLDDFRGRLGNHMCQYAAGFGIAYRHNLTFIIPTGLDLLSIFDITAEVFETSLAGEHFTRLAKGGENFYREAAFTSDIEIKTYGQSYKYFEMCPDGIRKEFAFRKHIQRQVNLFFHRLSRDLPNNTTFVGAHARRGEKANKTRSKNEGWVVPDESYFKKAMDYFRNTYINVVFIICSDTPSWTKEKFESQSDVYFCPGWSPESDLAILANCDHTIMSVGTFGFWAGWLANGTTIYYAHPKKDIYVTKHLFNESNSPFRHFYPQEWIPMQ